MARTRRDWVRLSDERLLDLRIRDLGLKLEESPLQARVEEVWAELASRGFRFRPHAWLSGEFFSPKGVPGIALPFYLAHPRLMRLERAKMLECEGAERRECLMILRHECGHAIQHAYELHRRRTWQKHFGSSTRRYPDLYKPNPASRDFVQHLRLYYAQSHPDEDFAETFAVWLGPRAAWRRRYAGWPALRKLEFVDALMDEIKDAPPPVRTHATVDRLATLSLTLREFYRQKLELYSRGQPQVYDRDLRRLFSDDLRDRRRGTSASGFLRRNRAEIRRLVARWTGEYQYTLDQVLREMIERCRVLRLRAVGAERKLLMDFAVLLTVQTMHYHYDRRTWIAL